MEMLPPIDQMTLMAIAELCAKLRTGEKETTGGEINHMLLSADLPNPTPEITKQTRIYNAFAKFQNEHQASNNICKFIRLMYSPSRFVNHLDAYREALSPLNKQLAFIGLELQEDGQLHRVNKATTLSEAEQRAQRLKQQLLLRNVHPKILKFAESEIASDNYFHTVLEAMKSVSSVLRELTLCYADGAELVDYAFSGKEPHLVINEYRTKSHKSEQTGFANLLKGLYSTFRNPTAHEAKVLWDLPEADALDVLSVISYVHRKLEKAHRI